MFEMESMEARQHLSAASLSVSVSKTGTLHVKGTSRADRISFTQSDDGVVVKCNGKAAGTVDERVKRVVVQGGAGKDRVLVDLGAKVTAKLVGGKGVDKLSFTSDKAAAKSGQYANVPEGWVPDPAPNPGWRMPEPGENRKFSFFLDQNMPNMEMPWPQVLTGVDVSMRKVGKSAEGTNEIAYWYTVFFKTRAQNAAIQAGTFPVETVNRWHDAAVNVFSADHAIRKFAVAEGDGTLTTYVYDASAGTVEVKIIDEDANLPGALNGRTLEEWSQATPEELAAVGVKEIKRMPDGSGWIIE